MFLEMALGEIIGGFSGFKGRLLLTAGVIVLGALSWSGGRKFLHDRGQTATDASWFSPAKLSPESGFGSRLAASLDRGGETIIRIGLSFMAAMVAASVLRAAFKTGVALILLAGLAIWCLDCFGDFSVGGGYLLTGQDAGSLLSPRVTANGEFLRHHLASASAALIGFGFGLKR